MALIKQDKESIKVIVREAASEIKKSVKGLQKGFSDLRDDVIFAQRGCVGGKGES